MAFLSSGNLSSRTGGNASSRTGSRRPEETIELSTTVPREGGSANPSGVEPLIGGGIVAAVGAAATALFGWVIAAGFAVIGWLAAAPGTLWQALGVGTQFWLLGNGGGATLGPLRLTLIPWGLTALSAVMHFNFAGYAARRSRAATRRGAVFSVVGVTVAVYVAVVTGAVLLVGEISLAPRAALVAALVAGLPAAAGACRSVDLDPTERWPGWARPLPRAVLAAQLCLLTGGAALLVTSLLSASDQVGALVEALAPGIAGNVALLVLQLAFAPNLIVWATAFALGAGFSFGPGTVVSPTDTDLGLLPVLPVLAGLPDDGPGRPIQLAWLAVGAVAGGVAAWLVNRARTDAAGPERRIDVTTLLGGLAGALSGVVFVALAWACGGDLGRARLAGIGPRLPELGALAISTTGLAGLLVGLGYGLVRLIRR